MELPDLAKKILQILFLLVLPWASLIAMLAVAFYNVWLLFLVVVWVGAGIIFYSVFSQG